MAEILSCPFCGGDACPTVLADGTFWRVECRRCPADMAGNDREDAIEAWNRRALSPAMGEETVKIDANDIWEALFSITKDAVPEELTNDVLAELAGWLNQMRRGA